MPARPSAALLALGLLLASPAPHAPQAAINPAAFVERASHVLHLRERARVVHEGRRGEARLRRVTVVAEVLEVRRGEGVAPGAVVAIDYTVDLTARERAARAHAARGPMPGPQFVGEPDPPEPDAQGRFWAALVPAAARADADATGERLQVSGPVFVPAAGQYSFSAAIVGR